jgi:hypothetical protein
LAGHVADGDGRGGNNGFGRIVFDQLHDNVTRLNQNDSTRKAGKCE